MKARSRELFHCHKKDFSGKNVYFFQDFGLNNFRIKGNSLRKLYGRVALYARKGSVLYPHRTCLKI